MTVRALLLGFGLLASPVVAEAPASSPVPLLRPAAVLAEVSAPVVVPVSEPILAPSGLALRTSPLPARRPTIEPVPQMVQVVSVIHSPAGLSAPLSSLIPVARPELAPVAVSASLPATGNRKVTKGGSVCGVASIKGKEIPPIRASSKGCGLADGVRVTSVSGVRLSVPADIDCATAKALNGWVKKSLIPAVGTAGGGVARLEIAASYVCRPRNNQKGNRVSEHGKGHALDISAIILESGKAISVQRDWGRGQGGRILKKVRAAACGPFTTVLGPGSDRFHRDHLHLDTARGRGPYCR